MSERASDDELKSVLGLHFNVRLSDADDQGYKVIARVMARELQERRAADLTPANADALNFALGAVHFYAGSIGCTATSKEIKAARDLLEKLLHGSHP